MEGGNPNADAEVRSATPHASGLDVERRLATEPSLELVQALSLLRNPDLRASLERWAASLEKVPQRSSLPYPSFRYGYSTMFRMNTFEFMQELPFPTKLLAETRAALAEARAEGADFLERRNLLRSQTASAYSGLYLARREVEIVDASLAVLGRLAEAARARYEAGSVTQSDVLRAEVEREALRADRAELVRSVEVAASALNILVDRHPEAPIGPLPPPPPPVALERERIEEALDRRAEVTAATERVAAAEGLLSRARQEWIPDFVAGGAYVRDLAMEENEAEVTVGLSIPLWGGTVRARIAEAGAEANRARADLRASRNRVLDEAKSASARLAAATERLRILADEAVPRAEQNLRVSEAAYVSGKIDFLALLDSLRVYLERQLDRERARAGQAVRAAELERAFGGRNKERDPAQHRGGA